MSLNLNKVALVDTGFWYAVFEERDQHYREAQDKLDLLLEIKYVLPWPILYETLCTRFVRRPFYMRKFDDLLKRPNAVLLDDSKYKDEALACTLSRSIRMGQASSLCDNVLRLVIEDINVKLNYLFTFNDADFIEGCSKRHIYII